MGTQDGAQVSAQKGMSKPSQRPSWSWLVSSLHSLHQATHPGTYLDLVLPEVNTPSSSPDSARAVSVQSPKQVPVLPIQEVEAPLPLRPSDRRFSEESGYVSSPSPPPSDDGYRTSLDYN